MSELHASIKQITDSLDYGREVKDNVRQASVIRIADLLENAGHVVNVRHSMPLSKVLNQPTVMEIGRVGSTQDTSLLMGFLLMRFAEEVERNPRPPDQPHITVVEEAHRLMAETPSISMPGSKSRGSAGDDFSNILAEVRGFGEGIIIAEQIPTMLVKGAIGNTYLKIMHWLEDAPSFDLFSNIMNLNPQQREYARTLTPGFAIVRSPFGRPVHLKVPEFGDQPGFDIQVSKNISDEQVRSMMAVQRQKLGVKDIQVSAWDISLSATTAEKEKWKAPEATLTWLLSIPLKTCAFCSPLHQSGVCQHGQRTRNRVLSVESIQKVCQAEFEKALNSDDPGIQWASVQAIKSQIVAQLIGLNNEDLRGTLYCYLAHEVDALLRESLNETNAGRRKNGRLLLQQFEKNIETA